MIEGIVTSIIGNLLTPSVKKLFSRWITFDVPEDLKEPTAPPHPEPTPNLSEEEQERIRAYNRERLQAISWLIFLYGFTFFFLYQTIALPMSIKLLGAGHFNLADTRIGFTADMSQESIRWVAWPVAIVLYYPFLMGAQRIAYYIAQAWNQLQEVTPFRFTSFIVLAFISLCLLLSGQWIFLLYPKYTYFQAVSLPFIITFIGIMYASSRHR